MLRQSTAATGGLLFCALVLIYLCAVLVLWNCMMYNKGFASCSSSFSNVCVYRCRQFRATTPPTQHNTRHAYVSLNHQKPNTKWLWIRESGDYIKYNMDISKRRKKEKSVCSNNKLKHWVCIWYPVTIYTLQSMDTEILGFRNRIK